MLVKTSSVAVVVPVHNGIEFTIDCLRQLDEREESPVMCVVVDDGSSDGTCEAVMAAFPAVNVIEGDGNLWWSGATNLGVRYATELGAEIAVLFNNDNVHMSQSAISRLATMARRVDTCVSAVIVDAPPEEGGRILHAGGELDWRNRGLVLRKAGLPYTDCVGGECAWLPGTALAVRVDVFHRVGGIDRLRFPQYRGDADLTLRLRQAGVQCLVAGDVWVVNDKRQTGLHFARRLPLSAFFRGLVSLRSNYNLRETLLFAFRHCPPSLIPRYLVLFYGRYCYAFLKSRRTGSFRERFGAASHG